MTTKGSLDVRLSGFPAANRDATVELTNELTGETIQRKTFLDGSLVVRNIDPGRWEMKVVHPNLVTPIDSRVVRVFSQLRPTRIPVVVRPDVFRDTPIKDIPDADLSPVQQASTAARDATAVLGSKAPGEVIRADDWNVLAGAVNELAGALLELTQLVSPLGHAHPEIETKVGEVQSNVRRFTQSFGRSLLELRRDIESRNLRGQVDAVIATANIPADVVERLRGPVLALEGSTQEITAVFSRQLAGAGNQLLAEVVELAEQQADPETWRSQPVVQTLLGTVSHYAEAGTQISAEDELGTYSRTQAVIGGSKFNFGV